ncbi:hypothetical protein KUC3_02750 [Alteromonas sp. KC3]|nr:hypothetical protein KUC3_02750 [Alteromonas sp. KC3]BCO21408.1 hypothetical protein KUC14_02770 [Alteromonas sp. KC14]
MLMQALVAVNLICCHKSTKTKDRRQGGNLKYNLNTNSADKTFNVNVTV